MGLDTRDSRTDISMILGDPDIPDDPTWDKTIRDKSCGWLDFVDASFNPCQAVTTKKTCSRR